MNKGHLDSKSREILSAEEKLHLAIQRGVCSEYKLPINKNKQNRHILGSKEFAYFDTKSKNEGKAGYSFFFPDFNILEVLPNLIGTGVPEFEKGRLKSELVKCSCNIGLGGRESLVVTDVLSIRYSSTGIHAFPVHPNVYDDAIKTLKKKNRQARFTASCRSVLIGFVINIQSFLVKVKKIVKNVFT